MANKLVRFYLQNDFTESLRISSIIKETKVTYTLIDDDGLCKSEYKTKKSDAVLDKMNIRHVSYSEGYPDSILFYTLRDESLVTEEFIAEIFTTMKKLMVDAYEEHMQKVQKKLEALSK